MILLCGEMFSPARCLFVSVSVLTFQEQILDIFSINQGSLNLTYR